MKQIHKPGMRYIVGGDECVLAQVDYDKFALIDLQTGNRRADPVEIEHGAMGMTFAQVKKLTNFSVKKASTK